MWPFRRKPVTLNVGESLAAEFIAWWLSRVREDRLIAVLKAALELDMRRRHEESMARFYEREAAKMGPVD